MTHYTAAHQGHALEQRAEEDYLDQMRAGRVIAETFKERFGVDLDAADWDEKTGEWEFILTEPTYVGPDRHTHIYADSAEAVENVLEDGAG